MFVESEIVIGAMEALRSKGIPSLPVHDSLIVQENREAEAIDELKHQFRARTGMVPKLDISRPDTF